MKLNNKKIQIIALSIILLIVVVSIIALVLKDKNGTQETQTQAETTTVSETKETVSHEGFMQSYLTGEWVSETIGLRRPVGVMLNNIKAGTPQTGISKAGIVYEAPVEGTICRLLAIFEDYDSLKKIGSVRSARTYFVYLAQEYDSILVHYGEAYYAKEVLNNDDISHLSGTSSIGTTVFYRTTDRVSPHNAYTSAEGINAGIEAMKFDTELSSSYNQSHFKFVNEAMQNTLDAGAPATKIYPGYSNNKPWFEYNAADQLYYRFQYDEKQIDDMTNEQLAYKNVILQYCNYTNYDATYLNIDVLSGGSGKYITNGKAIDITWKKDSTFGKTRYFDASGNEISLNQGKTWVCIILKDKLDKVQILE